MLGFTFCSGHSQRDPLDGFANDLFHPGHAVAVSEGLSPVGFKAVLNTRITRSSSVSPALGKHFENARGPNAFIFCANAQKERF